LYLNDNLIANLPESIGYLNNLELLFLDNNYLTKLPKSMTQLINLKMISLHNNDIKNLPKLPLLRNESRYLGINM